MTGNPNDPNARRTPPFLSIWFECCNTYGRLTRNEPQTRYEGRCPRCGVRASAGIGPDGTNRRVFRAR